MKRRIARKVLARPWAYRGDTFEKAVASRRRAARRSGAVGRYFADSDIGCAEARRWAVRAPERYKVFVRREVAGFNAALDEQRAIVKSLAEDLASRIA